jgi:hypothetical protein
MLEKEIENDRNFVVGEHILIKSRPKLTFLHIKIQFPPYVRKTNH